MQRLGLCCLFRKEPIHFKTTTARYMKALHRRGEDQKSFLSSLILNNVQSLLQAVRVCAGKNIFAFRISSRLFPLYTHPDYGYTVQELPDEKRIRKGLLEVKKAARKLFCRLSFHPDQFVVLNSPHPEVVKKSIVELEYHCLMATLLGADVINIHAGGAYGEKKSALLRFCKNFEKLSTPLQKLLTIENDDKIFTPEDLLPLCQDLKIPLVYDVHHHRCLPDRYSIEEATKKALETWDREPLFHISSPKGGFKTKNPKLHADFISKEDVPSCWKSIDPLTIDVEAKAKELAVVKLQNELAEEGWSVNYG